MFQKEAQSWCNETKSNVVGTQWLQRDSSVMRFYGWTRLPTHSWAIIQSIGNFIIHSLD